MSNQPNPLIEWPSQQRTSPLALVFTDIVGSSAAKRAEALGPRRQRPRPRLS